MDGIKEMIINHLMGELGENAKTYSVLETYGPNNELPRTIYIFPSHLGDNLKFMELEKLSLFILTSNRVTKDDFNLYGLGFEFPHKHL